MSIRRSSATSCVLYTLAVMLTGCGPGGPGRSTPAPTPAPAKAATARTEAAAVAVGESANAAPMRTELAAMTVGDPARAEAETIFATRCTPCHGPTGKGDGAVAATLTPRPRDFSLADWQAAVTDADIEKIIVQGGALVGKSPLMPPNQDLAGKAEVVVALRMKVRTFSAR